MSSFDRINQIENRISQMEARLEGGSPVQKTSTAKPGITSGRSGGSDQVSFESILNSVSADKKFRPTGGASGPTGATGPTGPITPPPPGPGRSCPPINLGAYRPPVMGLRRSCRDS